MKLSSLGTKARRYGWNLLIAIDQLGNTLLGGDPDETISSRTAKRVGEQRWAYWLCRALHWFDKDHCAKSVESDEGAREVIK